MLYVARLTTNAAMLVCIINNVYRCYMDDNDHNVFNFMYAFALIVAIGLIIRWAFTSWVGFFVVTTGVIIVLCLK